MNEAMVGQVYKDATHQKLYGMLRTLRVERVDTLRTAMRGRLKDGVRYAWCVSNLNGINERTVVIEEKRLLSKAYELILEPATIKHEASV